MNPDVPPEELWPPRYSDCRVVQSDDGVRYEAEVYRNAEALRDAAGVQTKAVRASNSTFRTETSRTHSYFGRYGKATLRPHEYHLSIAPFLHAKNI